MSHDSRRPRAGGGRVLVWKAEAYTTRISVARRSGGSIGPGRLPPRADPGPQRKQLDEGIPLAAFETSDLAGDYARLSARKVAFTQEPTPTGPVTIAVFADTCGNLIQLYQPS